jgi:membrane protease YdiL (CAAX protease family)
MLTQANDTALTIMAGIAFPTFLSCSLIVASFCFSGGAVRGLGFTARRWINDSIRSIVALIAVLPVCIALLLLTKWAMLQWCPDLIEPHEFLKILTAPATPPIAKAMIIFAAVVMAPIGEEIFFRGMMQSMLRRYLGRPWLGVIIASVLFAGVHFPVPESLPALLALAIALGYSYERTGRLYAPIMIHMLFNAVMIIEAVTNTG